MLLGEFGVVYKSHMFQDNNGEPKIVAAKTLKGVWTQFVGGVN